MRAAWAECRQWRPRAGGQVAVDGLLQAGEARTVGARQARLGGFQRDDGVGDVAGQAQLLVGQCQQAFDIVGQQFVAGAVVEVLPGLLQRVVLALGLAHRVFQLAQATSLGLRQGRASRVSRRACARSEDRVSMRWATSRPALMNACVAATARSRPAASAMAMARAVSMGPLPRLAGRTAEAGAGWRGTGRSRRGRAGAWTAAWAAGSVAGVFSVMTRCIRCWSEATNQAATNAWKIESSLGKQILPSPRRLVMTRAADAPGQGRMRQHETAAFPPGLQAGGPQIGERGVGALPLVMSQVAGSPASALRLSGASDCASQTAGCRS